VDRVIVEVREPGREPRRVSVTTTVEVGRECSGILLHDSLVSRRHLALTASAHGLTLTDLGSSNGTTVNGRRITDPVVVQVGDVIRLGRTEIGVVQRSAPPPRPASAPPERLTVLDPPPPSALSGAEAPQPPAAPAPLPAGPAPSPQASPATVVGSGTPARAVAVLDALRAAASSQDHVTLLVAGLAGGTESPEATRSHGEILASWVPRHGGQLIAERDDGRIATFASPRTALLCALATQRGFAAYRRSHPGPGEARAALHQLPAGGADRVEDGLDAVTRIAAAARPGEILVSPGLRDAVADLIVDDPREIELHDGQPLQVWRLRP
jgi:class 3 adenylate cyclase